MALDDSLQARVSTDCPDDVRHILHHAWAHDLSGLKPLLDLPGKASVQDPTTGETPLHAAIRACGPAATVETKGDDNAEDDGGGIAVEEAKETLRELFFSGAIWNDVDGNDETPGCVALRLGQQELYALCIEAGVRAELLFGLLDGYEALSSGPDEEMEDAGGDAEAGAEAAGDGEEANGKATNGAGGNGNADEKEAVAPETKTFVPPATDDTEVTSDRYLRSNLTYSEGKLVDDAGNGVMMAWETDIMRRSVDALLPSSSSSSSDASTPINGPRILNIGFGLGIIDGMFAAAKPSVHHIIEAHPAVLAHIATNPECPFGPAWERSGTSVGDYKVYAGRWQDVLPSLLEEGRVYDAIYFDTFGEDYSQLKLFFTEYVPGLLDEGGRFGFFNGLGADRQVCYDVYARVVEMHLADVGLDLEWQDVGVDMKGLEEAGKGEWDGVRRRYWALDKYRLPVCTFMG